MSANFSAETKVSNLLREYLQLADFSIIQLVHPGSQCQYSITYESNDSKKKTIFPDVILYNAESNSIILGEIKPKFSTDDKNKLIAIAQSKNGFEVVRRLVFNVAGVGIDSDVVLVLIHSGLHASSVEMVYQWVFGHDGLRVLVPTITSV